MDLFFKITFLFAFGFLFSQKDTITKPFKLKEVIIDAAHIKSKKKDLPFTVTQNTFNFSQKNLKQESLDEYLEGVPGLFSQNANNFAQDPQSALAMPQRESNPENNQEQASGNRRLRRAEAKLARKNAKKK